MNPTHIRDFHPRDLRVREGKLAPITKTLRELAENPSSLRADLFADHRRRWMSLPCADGAWISFWLSALNASNAGGTDAPGVLGSVSTIVGYIKEGSPKLGFYVDQVEKAHQLHNITGIQAITHPCCAGTKPEVCTLVEEAANVFAHPRKVKPQLFFETQKVELEIHRRDLDIFTDWVFETFSFIDAVEYLRGTKWRLEPFSHYEKANCRAIEVLKERGEWD